MSWGALYSVLLLFMRKLIRTYQFLKQKQKQKLLFNTSEDETNKTFGAIKTFPNASSEPSKSAHTSTKKNIPKTTPMSH